jgi:hypothetical protein
MKHIKTFESFLNENLNEGKYDNTWYDDINRATMADTRDKKSGGTGYAKRRDLAAYIAPGKDWSTATDKDVVKYINDLKKRIVDEQKNLTMYTKIEAELERIQKTNGIQVEAHANCPSDRRIQFVRPCLLNNDTTSANYQKVLDFLTGAKTITCIAHPTVVNTWDVEYDGEIINDKGDKIEYEKVNNGLAVMPG